jgi:fatty acid desaturase
MAPLFASGRIVDLILAFTVFEVVALSLYRRRTGHGVPAIDIVFNLLSGICLLGALRCALGGAWWGWIGACLFGSLVAHVADLWRRWR